MVVSGDTLYRAAASGDSSLVQLLADLKTHVKKDNVALPYVSKYFEALSIVMDSPDPSLQTLAFSLICHLVKRVSIQDQSGEVLASMAFLVLPIVISKMANAKSSTSSSAHRALEAYWLLAPQKVEQALIEDGLSNRNVLVVNESVVWLNHILTEVSPHFKLDAFYAPLADVLNKYASDSALVANIKVLFANYYDIKQNQLHRFELQKVLQAHAVLSAIQSSIIGTGNFSLSVRDTHESLRIPEVHKTEESRSNLPVAPQKSEDLFETGSSEIKKITENLTNYDVDKSIAAINVDGYDSLRRMISDMMPCFDNKETEKNWSKRERGIQLLRKLVRGNARTDYLTDLLQAIKDVSDGIQKSLLSLRTTLSVSSCQLVKEMAIFLGTDFDALAEIFLPTLIRLCSATKHMTHTNANVAVCGILINCTLSPRVVHRISTAAVDKGTSTRSYAALWLEIYMTRTHALAHNSSFELVDKLLPRLLGDPNSQVRQSAKDVYWRYRRYSPESSDELLQKLDSNIVRSLQRSRPPSEKFVAPLLAKKPRPSLKEAIMAKNKETRARTAEGRSNSSFLPRRPHEHDIEGNSNLAHRISSDPLKTLVPKKEPHYAQSTFSHLGPKMEKARSESPFNVPTNELGVGTVANTPKDTAGNLRSSLNQSTMFDSRNDPILKFLSSSQDDFMREGINLLRYALIGDEEISKEIISVVRKVSISHIELLRPLFEDGDNLFKKSKRLFVIDDFIRVCAILLPASDKNIEIILSLFEVEDIYDSINTLLSYVADLDNIVDEKLLVMQIIKFKPKILGMLVDFLSKTTVKMPISEVNFAKLTTNLFELAPIVHSTTIYPEYQILLRNLHSIDKLLFIGQLSLVAKGSKDEIEQTVGIDHTLHYNGDGTVFMTELTQITPGQPLVSLSPLRNPSDFTMLMPSTFQSDKESHEAVGAIVKAEKEMDIVEENLQEDVPMGDASQNSSYESDVSHREGSVAREQQEPNIFSTSLDEKRTDFFAKLSTPDSSHELAEDFAQVDLAAKTNSIQFFIDKVDPFNRNSLKNRQISIFEDSKSGSPQKIREYSYTDFNWFNFLVAKFSLERVAEDFESYSTEEFKLFCKKLGQAEISGMEFVALLRYLQNQQSAEFNQFYKRDGHQLIEQSLWMFFLSSKSHDKLSGLIIAKQLLINRDSINLVHLWHTLLDLSAGDCSYELEVAIGETFDEALCGVYSSVELFHVVTKTLRDRDMSETRMLRFGVESLYKLMSARTLALIINDDLIREVDNVLHGNLNHKDTLVRKSVLQTYGRLLRAVKVSDASLSNKSSAQEKLGIRCMDDLLIQVTGPQRKLIEFFSQ